ncbi:MAG: hypothetical protein JJU05_14250 [Verrucomicrobia bacterium]|nr:hypothetical protein [Verrucomicrobiota bacterium]MCH8526599.1 hypothetical protein [Kiritimatiellia bacterium]
MKYAILICCLISGLFPALSDTLQVTGRARTLNSQTHVPRGLFGVHATPLPPERIETWGVESVRTIAHNPGTPQSPPEGITHFVECFWDRYQPALIVESPDWTRRLTTVATTYGTQSRHLDRQPIVEFWNEPYLNWGVRPGVNYNGAFYRQDSVEPDTPMTLLYEQEPTDHLVWTSQRVAVRADNGRFDALATRFMPQGTEEGATWTWRNTLYRAETQPWGRDVTQERFWPGAQNVKWYNAMLKVFAPALKAANPEVLLVAGWDFHIHQNGYATWETVHRPTVDAGIEWIDGYAEHHYGGDTRIVAASYEMLNAYTRTRHGRFLKVYNTEAGGDLDPERPGPAQGGYNTTPPAIRDRAHYTYFMRDVLYLLDRVPDKAEARAAHEAHHGNGVATGFKMLRNFRGRLMETRSPHPDIWVTAALNDNRLIVAVYNDQRTPLNMPLTITAPRGSEITGIIKRIPDESLTMINTPLAASGTAWTTGVTLAVRETVVYEVTLGGSPDPLSVITHQFYAPQILQRLPAGESLTLNLDLPANTVPNASHAHLRIVHAGLRNHQHHFFLNGNPLAFQHNDIGIFDVPFPKEWLATKNVLEIRAAETAPTARIDTTSLLLSQSFD